MSSHYLHLYKSTVRLVTDLIAEIKAEGIASPTFINFDEMAQIAEWPNTDLVGTAQFSMSLDQHFINLTCAFGVSPYQDKQLLRHHSVMDRLVDRLRPTKVHKVYHANTGAELGWMIVDNGTFVRGMERTEDRPLQFIVASFQTGLTYKL